MNKSALISWLNSKANELRENTPKHLLNDSRCEAYLQGGVKAIAEIKRQIESGKFDNEKKQETTETNGRTLVEQGYYRHFKGKWYVVEYIAKHTETEESMVIYTEICNRSKPWARPLGLFMSEAPKNDSNTTGQLYRFMSNIELGMSPNQVLVDAQVK